MNLKRILAFTSAIVLCYSVAVLSQNDNTFTSIVVSAEDVEYQYSGSCGEDATFEFDESTGTLTISGTGEISYTPWSNYNASYNEKINSVIIEDGITSIGSRKFYDCISLTSVTIPNSVTSIGDCAFDGCTSLTKVTLPNSITSIGNGAFQGCTSLINITIPDSVTSIGWYAFNSCELLSEINIPNGVTYLTEGTFGNCTSLKKITISDSVTFIGNNTFSGCESLESITIPNSVTFLGERTFKGCTSLEEIIIPSNVDFIGEYAFEDCTSLTKVTITDGVSSIYSCAFWNCPSLKEITIPKSVTEIDAKSLGYLHIDNTSETTKIEDFIIYGVKGSEAERYATENEFTFIEIENNSSNEESSILNLLNLKKYILGLTQSNTGLDFNNDVQVNVLDMIELKNQLFN